MSNQARSRKDLHGGCTRLARRKLRSQRSAALVAACRPNLLSRQRQILGWRVFDIVSKCRMHAHGLSATRRDPHRSGRRVRQVYGRSWRTYWLKWGGLLARFTCRFIGIGVLRFAFRRGGSGGPSFTSCPQATFSHGAHCWPCGSIHNGSPITLKRSSSS